MTPEQADLLIKAIDHLSSMVTLVGISTIFAVVAARFIKL